MKKLLFMILVFISQLIPNSFIKTFNYNPVVIRESLDNQYILLTEGLCDDNCSSYEEFFGDGAFLHKLDSNGEILWTTDIGYIDEIDENLQYDFNTFSDVIQATDGTYIAAGNNIFFDYEDEHEYGLILIKVDTNGEILWKNRYLINNDESSNSYPKNYAKRIYETQDGNYFVQFSTNGADRMNVMKVSSEGDILWSNRYEECNTTTDIGYQHVLINPSANMSLTDDGGFIITGQTLGEACALKVNSTGTQEWVTTHSFWYDDALGYDIIQRNDGRYVMVGANFEDNSDGYIVLMDDSGERYYHKIIEGSCTGIGCSDSSAEYIMQIMEIKDGANWDDGYFLEQYSGINYVVRRGLDDLDIKFSQQLTFTDGSYLKSPNISNTSDNGFLVAGYRYFDSEENEYLGVIMKFESDGSLGCSDISACNYNAYDDYSNSVGCIYSDVGFDCDGNCIEVIDECGICDGDNSTCTGCMDIDACNFDESSTIESGNCEYPVENFNCDGTCAVEEDCANVCGGDSIEDECGICNGDGIADGACDCGGSLPEQFYNCDGECLNDSDDNGICDELQQDLSINENFFPEKFSIKNIYPNPFNPTTQITYGMPKNGEVLISVYDMSGRHIQTLLEAYKTAGYHTVSWNASSYPSGIYLIRMKSDLFIQNKNVVLVK